MAEKTLDEFLTEHADDVQRGSDTAVNNYTPPVGPYTTTLMPARFTSGADKKTGQPVGFLILPHKILDGPEAGQTFEWMGRISNGFFFGALQCLGKMLGITAQDPRALVREIVAKIAETSPAIRTVVDQRAGKDGEVYTDYRHEGLVTS